MDTLINPNFGYLLLMAGVVLAVTAVITPGTGLFELGALFTLLATGWFIYNLPVNYWALIILVTGAVLFIVAILLKYRARDKRLDYLLAASLVIILVGTAFVFRGESWLPGVHPLLILFVSILVGGYLWIAARKTLEAAAATPVQSLERLVGMVGEAKTEVFNEGSVQVAGELWSARCQAPIPAGSRVRVVGREGFILDIEKEN